MDETPDDQTARRVGEKLEAFVATLSPREQHILRTVLFSAMDPLDRMERVAPERLLDETELQILETLEQDERKGV